MTAEKKLSHALPVFTQFEKFKAKRLFPLAVNFTYGHPDVPLRFVIIYAWQNSDFPGDLFYE